MESGEPPAPPTEFGVPWPELNDGLSYSDVVKSPSPPSGWTLVGFYSTKYKNSAPFEGWIQRIRKGQIMVDGQFVTDPDMIVRVGAKLLYYRQPWREPDVPYTLEVLYEDDDILAVNKPSGLQVLPAGLFQQRTVLMQLQWRKKLMSSSVCPAKPLDQETHAIPVHRLGRGTSGILLCAKTKIAKVQCAAYFADGTSNVKNRKSDMTCDSRRRITKLYRALAQGIVSEDEVVIDQPIGTMRYPDVATGLYVASASGKPARSKVTVLERDFEKNHSLVQVEIHSGRPHQIRIHLSFLGHPLVGDPLYVSGGHPQFLGFKSRDNNHAEDGGFMRPSNPVPGDCGYHLHAHRLVIHHPIKDEVIEITAPLPPILHSQNVSLDSNCGCVASLMV